MLVYQTIHLILNRLLFSSFLFVSFRFFIRLFFFSFFFSLCVIVVDVYDYCLWCVHFDQITNAWLCKAVFSNVLEREKERESALLIRLWAPLLICVSYKSIHIDLPTHQFWSYCHSVSASTTLALYCRLAHIFFSTKAVPSVHSIQWNASYAHSIKVHAQHTDLSNHISIKKDEQQ